MWNGTIVCEIILFCPFTVLIWLHDSVFLSEGFLFCFTYLVFSLILWFFLLFHFFSHSLMFFNPYFELIRLFPPLIKNDFCFSVMTRAWQACVLGLLFTDGRWVASIRVKMKLSRCGQNHRSLCHIHTNACAHKGTCTIVMGAGTQTKVEVDKAAVSSTFCSHNESVRLQETSAPVNHVGCTDVSLPSPFTLPPPSGAAAVQLTCTSNCNQSLSVSFVISALSCCKKITFLWTTSKLNLHSDFVWHIFHFKCIYLHQFISADPLRPIKTSVTGSARVLCLNLFWLGFQSWVRVM